jgi:cysteinyl-tRNA synthetase
MNARRQKDFATADRIRDELAAEGKKMRDLPGNTSECALF